MRGAGPSAEWGKATGRGEYVVWIWLAFCRRREGEGEEIPLSVTWRVGLGLARKVPPQRIAGLCVESENLSITSPEISARKGSEESVVGKVTNTRVESNRATIRGVILRVADTACARIARAGVTNMSRVSRMSVQLRERDAPGRIAGSCF